MTPSASTTKKLVNGSRAPAEVRHGVPGRLWSSSIFVDMLAQRDRIAGSEGGAKIGRRAADSVDRAAEDLDLPLHRAGDGAGGVGVAGEDLVETGVLGVARDEQGRGRHRDQRRGEQQLRRRPQADDASSSVSSGRGGRPDGANRLAGGVFVEVVSEIGRRRVTLAAVLLQTFEDDRLEIGVDAACSPCADA